MAPEKSARTKGSKITENIKLWGIVQGVGFRPFVAKTASELDMKGNVLNIGGLVEITVTDTPERISAFLHAINTNKPEPAEIVHIKRSKTDYMDFDSFTIIKSSTGGDEAAMIPADLAICEHCLKELYNEDNPRYQHPFISCMICGPRYTIIDSIPYDRENTTMDEFPMCDFCNNEYTDIDDRRYHAQTISCHDCGPRLIFKCKTHHKITSHVNAELPTDDVAVLNDAAQILKDGGIILFKSVGGYNLVANPFSSDAVSKLRQIKNREEKPFAIMFRSIDEVKKYCYVNPIEEKLLSSSARPIILLEHLPSNHKEINKSRFIGSFLPSFAAQYLLLDRISPLIFTSANLSDMPMIKDDEEAFLLFENSEEIDAIIYNERQILTHVDDSVARVIDGQPQMIRRSKGYAPIPLYINHNSDSPENINSNHEPSQIFAAGGQLKNSFSLSKGGFTYMSQYLGDMDTIENQSLYKKNLNRLMNFFRIKPNAVVCDMHPLYFTSQYAREYAKAHHLPLIEVQHHHAHIASVMAENGLNEPVIGVCFDGTGYGTDGKIWGGEFLLCDKANFKRIAHLRYIDMIGGDSSVKDALRSAASYVYAYDKKTNNSNVYYSSSFNNSDNFADDYIDESESIDIDIADIIEYGRASIMNHPNGALVCSALKNNINTIQSSSMGRLFDAISALLGIKTYNDYEGQCTIMLEDAAAFAANHPGVSKRCDLALSFHNRIIDMILSQCIKARQKYGTNLVALSGGTFQNRILMEGILKKLRDAGFKPHYNISVSPNDGGIALGQTYIAMHSNTI